MPLRLPTIRLTRRRVITTAVVLLLVAGLVTWAALPAPRHYSATDQRITVMTGPTASEAVSLDTTFYLPDSASSSHPVPAVLLAHGFGGTKRSVASQAQDLANRGYAVLTWTAQGFGASGGQIHLDSPDYEVRDAQQLVDWLAKQPAVQQDGPGDPRVAAVGGSYGGALVLMLAGTDKRVDAIVPEITWNDLANAFLPDADGDGPDSGVFKKQWAGLFFGTAAGAANLTDLANLAGLGGLGTLGNLAGQFPPAGTVVDPQCGRFAQDICQAYFQLATAGQPSATTLALLQRNSPAPLLGNIKAPTLLIQGQADSLFPLTEAEANYRGIAATGTPVRMDWFTGGHDGGAGPQSDQDRDNFLTLTWLDYYLKHQGSNPGTGFTFSRLSGFDADTRRVTTAGFSSDLQPGAPGNPAPVSISLVGPPQPVASPPNGTPGAISTVPGVGTGSLSSLLNGSALEIPGQHADFYSPVLSAPVDVLGAPTVQILAASSTGEAVLFLKLYDLDPSGSAKLPFGLTTPVRLTGLPDSLDQAHPVQVTLPAIVYRFNAGDRIRLTVASSDQAFLTPAAPALYTVGVTGGPVVLPQLVGTPIPSPDVVWRYALAGLIALIVIGIVVTLLVIRSRRRHDAVSVMTEYEDTPLVVRGLRKEYGDGFAAVSKVDFTVHRGQVVGLLGPNGAGKTTSLRVLMGMTQATAGEIYIFGHKLKPGAEVLTRLGALVEGPGFMPHLSGLDNLTLFWRSTGRPAADARLDDALEIAGLGDAIHRKVSKYSHGMKQRLAIAQAMLGLPELLVLDEPTDGLDPPQIAEMRRVLRAYATDGRAVLVSSHLLAEVEQTCTHVVVMNKGEVVADGLVDDIVGDSPIAHFDVSDIPAASTVLSGLGGVRSVEPDGSGLVVDLDGTPRADVVAALVNAGVGVDRVVPRRRLEDAFLSLVGGDSKGSGER
jgi:ABC-2 type transport system ATP-binding protein